MSIGDPPGTIIADAEANYEVALTTIKRAFYFSTNAQNLSSLTQIINNPQLSDIKYFVNWPSTYILNPSHAFSTVNTIATTDGPNGIIPTNRRLVKHDFLRHVANDLFKTHRGVDLFINEEKSVEDLASNGNSIWLNYIKPKIDAVSTGVSLVDAVKGYTTDANTTSANLCRVLFRQMIYSDSSRFNNLRTLDGPGRNTNPNSPNVSNSNNPNVANNSNTYYLPFKVGDTISFISKPQSLLQTL